jgi:hypothetical protein
MEEWNGGMKKMIVEEVRAGRGLGLECGKALADFAECWPACLGSGVPFGMGREREAWRT